MKRIALLLSLVLVLVACGGGEEAGTDGSNGDDTTASSAATTASTTATTPTTSDGGNGGDDDDDDDDGGPVFTGDFCEAGDADQQLIDGVDFLAGDLETQMEEWLAALNMFADQAPAEIRDDVAVLVNAANQLAEVLADADYNFLNIDPDDPRILALDDGSLDEASNNIAEYCGWDLDADPTAGGGDGTGGNTGGIDALAAMGLTDTEVPDSIPGEMVPPDVVGVLDNGVAGVMIGSSAAAADILAVYEAIFGSGTEAGDSVSFSGSFDDRNWSVTVAPVDGVNTLVILVGF